MDKKKKAIYKKWWFWLLALFLFSIGGVCFQVYYQVSTEGWDSVLVDAREDKYKKLWSINNPVEDNGIELTVLGINQENIKVNGVTAGKSKKFILVNVKIQNKTSSNKDVTVADFKLQNSNGELLEVYHTTGLLGDFYFKGGTNELLTTSELSPNGYKEGNLLFEVEQSPTELILIYNNNLLKGNNDIKIKIL